jgi:osmotically inducible protein OsmC
MKRKATAVWTGHLTTQSGAFNEQPYSFRMRFENEDGKLGTNPEELIGAAHAGCFAMALAVQLSNEGFTPERLQADAEVSLEKGAEGFAITTIQLNLEAKVPGISREKFMELAQKAKGTCPVSRLLRAEIRLEARLV